MNAAANLGVRIKEIYWTLGAFDAVFTADAPDEETHHGLYLERRLARQYSHANHEGVLGG